MDKFLIHGGVPLEGEIAISGAKNSALPALAACLLTSETVKLQRIPPVRDIGTMQQLLRHAGAEVDVHGGCRNLQRSLLADRRELTVLHDERRGFNGSSTVADNEPRAFVDSDVRAGGLRLQK